ncbi:DUF2339 domain-containing protein [Niveibacterium sp. SC-1]|uniref:DUF2339 domain-containing protein n=1 Tax=Niveibacterium sp. SC-1 TaxID=3135646 RepID=UPI00311FDE12
MSLIFSVVGLVAGLWLCLTFDLDAWVGAAFGAVFGFLFGRTVALSRKFAEATQGLAETRAAFDAFRAHFDQVTMDIHRRFLALEGTPPAVPAVDVASAPVEEMTAAAEQLVPVETPSAASAPEIPDLAPEVASAQTFALDPVLAGGLTARAELPQEPESVEVDAAAPVFEAREYPEPSGPSLIERAFAAGRDWLLGGNTLVRVGIVLLFLGLAFLLRYASERTHVPVELRYAAVAASALALLVLGWRLRLRSLGYGLLLQGAAVAVLYLTVFAAMRLHPLIAPPIGFALMVVVAVLAAVLALRQDAPGLAIAGTLGGFAAPILASTGGGSHVALFSYFLLLNAGVLVIAWFKAWRVLNLVGFIGTFGIGFAWGLRSYRPELFASTEPFLVAFFLMYVAITLLFARARYAQWQAPDAAASPDGVLRSALAHANAIDGSLLFGVPIVGFGLQAALVRHIEFGMAFSALVLGGFYLLLARLLYERVQLRYRLLMEAFLALCVIFISLAIPLALDERWTSAAWAVEAAGLYWIALRQQRSLARAFALLLLGGASVWYLATLDWGGDTAQGLLRGGWLGSLLLAAAFLSNFRFARVQREVAPESALPTIFSVCGLGFAYLVAPLLLREGGTSVTWAAAGLASVGLGLWLREKSWLACGFAIQFLAGVVYLLGWPPLGPLPQPAPAFVHAGFLVPLAIALAAFLTAWCVHARGVRVTGGVTGVLSLVSLVWATGWWAYGWTEEVLRVVDPHEADARLLAVAAVTFLAWAWAARRWTWPELARLCGLLVPVGALFVLRAVLADASPFAAWGWASWALMLLAHGLVLWRVAEEPVALWRVRSAHWVHALGASLFVAVLSLALAKLFEGLGDAQSAWRWLGWVIAPAAYLGFAARSRAPAVWPLSNWFPAYRNTAGSLILVSVLAWVFLSNFGSDGSASPLPYLPLFNPLELGYALVFLAGALWLRGSAQGKAPDHAGLFTIALAALAFLSYTMVVARGVHHLADVPFTHSALNASMRYQATLSLAWSALALGLMVWGHRLGARSHWILGAVLIAAVVVKLFFVELSDSGGLERIVSFIGVGILLLVVGYFAPLPPAKVAQEARS